MPIVTHSERLEGRKPKGNHLALLTDATTGSAIAIPVGATMFLITNPDHVDGVIPMFLVKVDKRQIVFRCACGNPTCTRVLKYKLIVEGRHPPTQRAAVAERV